MRVLIIPVSIGYYKSIFRSVYFSRIFKKHKLRENIYSAIISQSQYIVNIKEIYIFCYYPPEVRRGEYWGLEVFLLQYFPLVNI